MQCKQGVCFSIFQHRDKWWNYTTETPKISLLMHNVEKKGKFINAPPLYLPEELLAEINIVTSNK